MRILLHAFIQSFYIVLFVCLFVFKYWDICFQSRDKNKESYANLKEVHNFFFQKNFEAPEPMIVYKEGILR